TSTLTSVIYYAFSTILPKWMEREVGMALGDGLLGIGALVTAIYLIGSVAQFFGGHMADRGLAKPLYVASFALQCASLVVALLSGGWPVVLAASVVVIVFDIAAPVENVLVARYAPKGRRGLAYGIRSGIAIVAAPLGVQLVALLIEPSGGVGRLL